MRRPIIVSQRENQTGDFWYTARAGNAENILTSKMYRERWRAIRAARAFIASIRPAPVTFTHWSGPTPEVERAGRGRGKVQHHTERFK